MLAWMSIRPQERWNIRSENGPCTRVTWLWYSSIGLMRPAAVLVVLGIGSEDARQQHPRAREPAWMLRLLDSRNLIFLAIVRCH